MKPASLIYVVTLSYTAIEPVLLIFTLVFSSATLCVAAALLPYSATTSSAVPRIFAVQTFCLKRASYA